VVPGHVFPVTASASAAPAGACVAHAASVAARLAGGSPVAAYGEAVDERGFPADRLATARLARRLSLELVSVREILLYADRVEPKVTRVVETSIPTPPGRLTAIGYIGTRSALEYVAFVAAPLGEGMRVHVHRRCQVSDVFGGAACGCGEQLRHALAEMQHAGNGVVIYHGDTLEVSCARGRGVTASAGWATSVEVGSILRDLGANRIFLSSNEPLLLRELEGLGLRVTDDERDDWLDLAAPQRAAGL
jgi:3,4-dihydroxy 2-butanone 4-phosphate synthase/GTP cyclohydrolase II